MPKEPRIEYLPDEGIDDALDQELRTLLSTCFTRPQDGVFRTQRYFLEPYPNRWVIRSEQGAVVAHVGVHEKAIEVEGRKLRIGGIAEVCVHPDFRGRGYVRSMLALIHDWLRDRGFTFAILFGRTEVYQSSGYVRVNNLLYGGPDEDWIRIDGMVHALAEGSWPVVDVHLPGPTF